MRTMIKTSEYSRFFDSLPTNVKTKIDYITNIIIQNKIVSSKFVKKLEHTDFYEMRVSVENEYRVILFTVDHPNFIESTTIILLNGFIKKSTKDYKRQIEIAEKILRTLSK